PAPRVPPRPSAPGVEPDRPGRGDPGGGSGATRGRPHGPQPAPTGRSHRDGRERPSGGGPSGARGSPNPGRDPRGLRAVAGRRTRRPDRVRRTPRGGGDARGDRRRLAPVRAATG